MSTQLKLWTLCLVLLLMGAYLAHFHKQESGGAATEVTVLDLKADEIDKLEFENDKRLVVVEAKTDAAGRYYGVTLSEVAPKTANDALLPKSEAVKGAKTPDATAAIELPKAPAPVVAADHPKAGAAKDAPEAADAAKKALPKTKVRRFAAGRSAKRLFDRLSPLTAFRQLDKVSEERLKALGLSPPEATFSVSRGSRTFSFGVGGSKFGGSRRYLHEQGTPRVYLVDATALRTLEGAERQLLERSLTGLKRADIDALTVSAGDKHATLNQQNRDDRRAAFWALGAGTAKDSEASGWIDKFFRLRVDSYPEALPDGSESVLKITLKTETVPVTLELLRGLPAADDKGAKAGQPLFYARSSYLRMPVKLYQQSASELVDDLAPLFEKAGRAPAPTGPDKSTLPSQ